MLRDLKAALTHIIKARKFANRWLTRHRWPMIYEDLDHLIKDLHDIITDRVSSPKPPP